MCWVKTEQGTAVNLHQVLFHPFVPLETTILTSTPLRADAEERGGSTDTPSALLSCLSPDVQHCHLVTSCRNRRLSLTAVVTEMPAADTGVKLMKVKITHRLPSACYHYYVFKQVQDCKTNLVKQLQDEWSKQVIHTPVKSCCSCSIKTLFCKRVVIGGTWTQNAALILTAQQNTLWKTLKNDLVCNTLKQYAC